MEDMSDKKERKDPIMENKNLNNEIAEDILEEADEVLTEEELAEEIVTITMDDNTEVHCVILGIFEAENDREYIALLPLDGPEAENDQVYIYRYDEDESEQPILENIANDEEFALASQAFAEMMEELDAEASELDDSEE
jgi:uncharacterized protein YrzB (UPF0473 family)